MSSRSVLIVFRATAPLVAVVDGHPHGAVRVGVAEYAERPISAEPFLGFYDWLRTTEGQLVGFRLTIGIGSDELRTLVSERSYVSREGEHIFCVYFRHCESRIDEENSAEQDFGPSRAFVSREGELMLAIDAAALTEEELATLETETPHEE